MKETEFILYMQHVGSTTSSKSAVMEAVNGVSWVQQLAGYSPVSGAPKEKESDAYLVHKSS